MFKRRKPLSYTQMATEMFWPRAGWRRAGTYVLHRVRRLPDAPHRIGRGVGAGIFISFTPLFGLHFMGAAAVAWLIRGNILAALLATFIGNPVTTPFIAISSVSLGRWMLGLGPIGPKRILHDLTRASHDLWNNLMAIFTDKVTHWDGLLGFWHDIFLPYLVGGIVPGIIAGILGHYLTLPVIRAYHKRRDKKMAERIARVRARSRPGADGTP